MRGDHRALGGRQDDAGGEEERRRRAASRARSASARPSRGTRRGRCGRRRCPSRPRTRRRSRARRARRRSRSWSSCRGSGRATLLQRVLLGRREEPLQVAEDARLDARAPQHLAEDEEDQQDEREDGEHQVVGDHRREPGDVLPVGAVPEGAQPGLADARRLQRHGARRSGRLGRAGQTRGASAPARRRSAPSDCLPDLAERPAREPDAGGRGSACEAGSGAGELLEAGLRAAAAPSPGGAAVARRCSARRCRGAARRGLSTPGRVFGRLPRRPLSSSLIAGHSGALRGRSAAHRLRCMGFSP